MINDKLLGTISRLSLVFKFFKIKQKNHSSSIPFILFILWKFPVAPECQVIVWQDMADNNQTVQCLSVQWKYVRQIPKVEIWRHSWSCSGENKHRHGRAMHLLCHMSSAHLSCLRLRRHCLTRNSGSRHRTTLTAQSWARALWVMSEPSWGVRSRCSGPQTLPTQAFDWGVIPEYY